MRNNRQIGAIVSTLALSLALSACDSKQELVAAPAPVPPVVVAPAPTPGPSPTPTSFNVQPCLDQIVVPGRNVASLVVPDVISINLAQPAGFPNGRLLTDPVVDVTLAALFLDLRRHSVTTFAALPLNPTGNDAVFRTGFPFFAPPQGMPPISSGSAASYNFRTDAEAGYVTIDRTGMPAVSAALIGGPTKIAFNDSNPAEDATGRWVPEMKAQLTLLHNALADDFARLGLTSCAIPA